MPLPPAVMMGDRDTKGEAGYQECSLPKSLLFRKWANTCSWRARFFFIYLFIRKEWLIQQLAIISRHRACDNRVRSRQRIDCTPCKGIKIMDIFPAQWLRQIWAISTERQKHWYSDGLMALNPPAAWELSRLCPSQTGARTSACQLRQGPAPPPAHPSDRSLIYFKPISHPGPTKPFISDRYFSQEKKKKLSLGRRKPKNYLFPFKYNNKNHKNHSIPQDQTVKIRGKMTVRLQKVNRSLSSWGAAVVWRSTAPTLMGQGAAEAPGAVWGHAPSLREGPP